MSLEGDFDRCGCSKVEAIVDGYNRNLETQLETQTKAKSKVESSISEAVEKAVTSRMQDIQNKLEKCTAERNTLADVNRSVIKNQEIWRKKVKEVEERKAASLKLRDEKILDFEEQIRDLKIYLEAQKTMADSNGIKEGTVSPVAYQQSSSAKQ